MKRYAIVMMGLICALTVGCSKGDRKNNSRPGPAVTQPGPASSKLTVGESDSMQVTVFVDGTEITLVGEVKSDAMKPNALSSENGEYKADVFTLSGKKYVFVIVHSKDGSDNSTMFQFTQNGEAYELNTYNVRIGKSSAMDKILEALKILVGAGMTTDEAVNEISSVFADRQEMSFDEYLASLKQGDYGKDEGMGEPVDEPSKDPIDEPVFDDNKRFPPAAPSTKSGCNSCSNSDVVSNDLPDSQPRYFGPHIKPQITEPSVRYPKQRRPVDRGGNYSDVDPNGRTVIIACSPADSKLIVKGQSRSIPQIVGCLDRNNDADQVSSKMEISFLGDVDSIRGLDVKMSVDLSRVDFLRSFKYKLKPVLFPNHGAKWGQSETTVIKSSPGQVTVARSVWMNAPYRDSFNMGLVCNVRRTNRQCRY